MKQNPDIRRWATLSRCRRYRYALRRQWRNGAWLGIIGLNPSTADGQTDDPTIRRCISIATELGFGGLVMLNVFALRSPDPRLLATATDPCGPGNRRALLRESQRCRMLVAAWGNHCPAEHSLRIATLLNRDLYCFRRNKGGQPAHPLYLPQPVQPQLFFRAAGADCAPEIPAPAAASE